MSVFISTLGLVLVLLVFCVMHYCHMSHDIAQSFFISYTAHLLADHLDFICCQNMSCCSCRCIVSTPSSIAVHPSCLGGVMVHSALCCLLSMSCPPISIVWVYLVVFPILLGLFSIAITSSPVMLVISPIAFPLLDAGIRWCGFCLCCLPGTMGILLPFVISISSCFVCVQRNP